MALEIDGLAVLCAIAEAPEAFPDIRSDVTKAAHALVVKQLKAKSLTYDGLRKVGEALGSQPLALIVDGLKDAEVKALVTRLDKHRPDLKSATAIELRRHLLALAAGAAPAEKPETSPKPDKPRPASKAAKAEKTAEASSAAPGEPTAPARPARSRKRIAASSAPVDALASAAMSAKPPPRRRQGG